MRRSKAFMRAGTRNFFWYWSLAAVAGAGFLPTGSGAWAADKIFTARTVITLPGTQKITSFDLGFVDPVIGLYLLADRTNKAVDVIDTYTNDVLVQLAQGKLVGVPSSCASSNVNRCAGPNGVLTVGHREVWVGDGDSTIKVIDLFSQQITHTIPTGGKLRTNEGCYDPRDHLFLTGNSGDLTLTPPQVPFLSLVSTLNYSILQTIPMDGTKAPGGGVNTPKSHERHRRVPMGPPNRQVLCQYSGGQRPGQRQRGGCGGRDLAEAGNIRQDRSSLEYPYRQMLRAARHGGRTRSSNPARLQQPDPDGAIDRDHRRPHREDRRDTAERGWCRPGLVQ